MPNTAVTSFDLWVLKKVVLSALYNVLFFVQWFDGSTSAFDYITNHFSNCTSTFRILNSCICLAVSDAWFNPLQTDTDQSCREFMEAIWRDKWSNVQTSVCCITYIILRPSYEVKQLHKRAVWARVREGIDFQGWFLFTRAIFITP